MRGVGDPLFADLIQHFTTAAMPFNQSGPFEDREMFRDCLTTDGHLFGE